MSRRLRLGLLIFAASTTAGLYFATKLYLSHPAAVRKSWPYSVAVNLANYWAWGVAVPAVVALGRRFPFGSKRWLTSLPVHLAAGVLLSSLGVLVPALTLSWLRIYTHPPTFELMRRMMRLNFHSSFEMYWLILLAFVAVDYQRRYKERELGAAQLQGRLTAARLEALRMQLNPHFLFNALNSISSLMYVDAHTADTMIRKLGELLRLSLDQRRGDEITLRDEIDFLQHYLDIERLRFEDRLRVRLDLDPEALPAMVPTFLLQPLVENALRHAIAPRSDGGSVEISVRRDQGWLRIVIADDGPGLPEGRVAEGVGLANTRERLNQLYGLANALRLTPLEGRGLRVDVMVPFHTVSDTPAPLDNPPR